MPDLSVSEEQLQRLEAVCDDLEAVYGGPYGTVRPEDALEYLLDTYTPPEESEADAAAAIAGGEGAGAGDGDAGEVPAGTDGAEAEPDGDLTDIVGVGEATADALVEAGFESIADLRAADPVELTETDGIAEKQAIDIKAEVADFDGGGSGADGDDGGGADGGSNVHPGSGGGAESPEDTLQQAMSLLDQHDDRWRESGGDEPYEVDLPDGGTEAARTKDDVKRLLFEHWR